MDARTSAFFTASLLLALAPACAERRPLPYLEGRCDDAARPCTLSYDFEPSGAAPDPFARAEEGPRFLVVNEDGVLFRWSLGAKSAWDHDHVQLARSLGDVLQKAESAASGTCGGAPVFLAASNFMPARKGRVPERERIVALVGSLDAAPRVLEHASRLVQGIAAAEGTEAAKVEGLSLSRDCRTLLVGVRSVTKNGQDEFRDEVYPLALDVDWQGTREEATLGAPFHLGAAEGCSGRPEGVSALETLADGTLLALTSFEEETKARTRPAEIAEGKLAGSLWRLRPGAAKAERIACIPGHKPEALAVWPDEKSVRVLCEDDDYGGRPIGAYAVRVLLP